MHKTLKREDELRAKELNASAQLWYLSFAKPKSEGGFQGAVIVPAHGLVTALDRVNELGINPGGSVMCIPLGTAPIRHDFTDRLLNFAELESVFGELERAPERAGTTICEHCNEIHGPETIH